MDDQKHIIELLQAIQDDNKEIKETLNSNNAKKLVFEIANRDFVKNVTGDSGAGNKSVACDNTQTFKLDPSKNKVVYGKTKLAMYIMSILTMSLALAELIKAIL